MGFPASVKFGKKWKASFKCKNWKKLEGAPGSERMDLPGRERMDLPGQNFQKKEETFVSSVNPDFPP